MSSQRGFFIFSSLLIILAIALASSGDEQEVYWDCLEGCLKDRAHHLKQGQSLWMSVLGWDGPSHCRYECMWQVESINRAMGIAPQQYDGKWPFVRIWGLQEPASVFFSLLNLLAHIYGYRRIFLHGLGKLRRRWFMSRQILLFYLTSLLAWTASAIFHSRDNRFTEKIDYFAAISLLFVSLNFGIIRALSLKHRFAQLLVSFSLLAYYLRHVRYMTWIKFDYSWNMKVGVMAGLAFAFIFLLWSSIVLYRGTRPHAKFGMAAVMLILAAAPLEIFDFPPYFDTIDAHSLWHAATAPAILLWYTFFLRDAQHDIFEDKTSKLHKV